jgi:hypothetical protein
MKVTEAINFSFYQSKMAEYTFDTLVAADPTPTKQYARWIVETYLKLLPQSPAQGNFMHWISDGTITEMLTQYDTYKKANVLPLEYRDIMKLKGFYELQNFLRDNEKNFNQQIKDKNAHKGIKVLSKTKESILLIPFTFDASVKYGTGSAWCTATASSDNHYKQYARDGTLYIHRWYKPDGSFYTQEENPHKGYQLYIPSSTDVSMNTVQCMDLKDVEIKDIDDFFLDIDYDIEKPIREAIEAAGGYNVYTEIEMYINSEFIDDESIDLNVYCSLVSITQNDIDYLDQGDNTTNSETVISLMGQGINWTDETLNLSTITEFNFDNGQGLYWNQKSETNPEEAWDNATNKWHDAGRDRDTDSYEFDRNIKKLTENITVQYIVFNGVPPKDYISSSMFPIHDVKTSYFSSDSKPPRVSYIQVEDADGTDYEIYYLTGYDYTPSRSKNPDDWISTPQQRARDKQQKLPYGL